jgi:hypothetical protein
MNATSEIGKDSVQALLASTQQLRVHWAGNITTHFMTALTVNVALWSYFLTSYFHAPGSTSYVSSVYQDGYLLVVSGLSSILFGLWRWSTRRADHFVATLYPDLLLYEGLLGAPPTRSTSGYLCTAVPNIRLVLESDMPLQEKVDTIADLVRKRRIGDRGHRYIDVFVLVTLIITSGMSLWLFGNAIYACAVDIWFVFLLGNGVGLWGAISAMTQYQRNPGREMIERSMQESKK